MFDFLESCQITSDVWMKYLYTFSGGLGVFLFYYLVFLVLKYVVGKIIDPSSDPDRQTVFTMVRGALRMLLLSLGLMGALSKWGFDISGIIATLGLSGFALGLALKDAISNVVAGVMIILHRPFVIGSKVSIAGVSGTVIKIEIQKTTLQDGETDHVVPNSKMLGQVISVSQ